MHIYIYKRAKQYVGIVQSRYFLESNIYDWLPRNEQNKRSKFQLFFDIHFDPLFFLLTK
jgi:UTP-glucose-1-phosphate uridylyltransferase